MQTLWGEVISCEGVHPVKPAIILVIPSGAEIVLHHVVVELFASIQETRRRYAAGTSINNIFSGEPELP